MRRQLGIESSMGGQRSTVDRAVIRNRSTSLPASVLRSDELLTYCKPRIGLPNEVNNWREENHGWLNDQSFYLKELEQLEQKYDWAIPHFYGRLALNVARCRCGNPESHPWSKAHKRLVEQNYPGNLYDVLSVDLGISPVCPKAEWFDYGLASLHLITDDGVAFLVDAFQNSTELENVEFHGIGEGSDAAAQTDTALLSELTTQYNPDNTRATGSNTEGASANIYRTVGTNTVDAVVGIAEHGVLTQAATGGGTLWDRHVFADINLGNGDSLQSTYDATFNAGG